MKLIKLTMPSTATGDDRIYINADKIESMCADGNHTTITVADGRYYVKETLEEILQMVENQVPYVDVNITQPVWIYS